MDEYIKLCEECGEKLCAYCGECHEYECPLSIDDCEEDDLDDSPDDEEDEDDE